MVDINIRWGCVSTTLEAIPTIHVLIPKSVLGCYAHPEGCFDWVEHQPLLNYIQLTALRSLLTLNEQSYMINSTNIFLHMAVAENHVPK